MPHTSCKPDGLITPAIEKGDTMIGPDGLTKREFFAAMAMQGFCSTSELDQTGAKIAMWSVSQADLLIKELNK